MSTTATQTKRDLVEILADVQLEQALEWHLQYNFFPAKDLKWVKPAVAAIKAAREDDWDRIIPGPKLPASEIIERLRIDSLI